MKEWDKLRQIVWDAAADAAKISGFEKLKLVKLIADASKAIQDGERLVISDALLDFDSSSDEELAEFAASGRLRPRRSAQPAKLTTGKPR